MKSFALGLPIAVLLIASNSHAQVTPTELDNRMNYWLKKLPYCDYGQEKNQSFQFPSKEPESEPDPKDTAHKCNDGDAVSLGGLTCTTVSVAKGIFVEKAEEACKTVKDSQGKDGRFWRSPKKLYEYVNNLPTSTESSSSNDSVQGVWAYIAEKRDVDAFRSWTKWMMEHRQNGIWPQYCLEKNCLINFGDCPMLDRIAVYLKEANPLCNPHPRFDERGKVDNLRVEIEKLFKTLDGLPASRLVEPQIAPLKKAINETLKAAELAATKSEDLRDKAETLGRVTTHAADLVSFLNSYVNGSGVARQDVAYSVYLLKKYGGFTSQDAAKAMEVIGDKEPENAFFEYVRRGPSSKMLEQIVNIKGVEKCPSEGSDKPHRRTQWIWEREDRETDPKKDQPWVNTMYWDCLFVANLYKSGGPIKGFNLPSPPEYGRLSKQAEEEFQRRADATTAVMKILDDLRLKLMNRRFPDPGEIANLLKQAHQTISGVLPGPAKELDDAIVSVLPTPVTFNEVKSMLGLGDGDSFQNWQQETTAKLNRLLDLTQQIVKNLNQLHFDIKESVSKEFVQFIESNLKADISQIELNRDEMKAYGSLDQATKSRVQAVISKTENDVLALANYGPSVFHAAFTGVVAMRISYKATRWDSRHQQRFYQAFEKVYAQWLTPLPGYPEQLRTTAVSARDQHLKTLKDITGSGTIRIHNPAPMVACLPDTIISISGSEDSGYETKVQSDPKTSCGVPIRPDFIEKQRKDLQEKIDQAQMRYLELKKEVSGLEEVLRELETYRARLRRWAAKV